MKFNRFRYTLLVLLMPLASYSWALEALDDAELAHQTGQDGVTIGLVYPNATISYDQVILTDKDGFGATGCTAGTLGCSPNAASLVVAPTTANQGVQLLNSGNAAVSQAINFIVDSDGNAGAPVLNARIVMPSDLATIRVNPFSVYLATGSTDIYTTRPALRSGVTKIVEFTQNTDINLDTSSPLALNLQLGNVAQGAMLQFTGGIIKSANVPGIKVYSKTGNNAESSSLNLDISLTATANTGFHLHDYGSGTFGGFYAGIADQGLIFGATGTTDKFNVAINNIVAGMADTQDSNSFNNLKNGALGSFGAVGTSVTNLSILVKGM